ncbi:hypothetical protein Q5H92_08970 [Hymenobacter sp. M29]|uniref:Phage portal protein n=1 Tax=Hymenobacter mellowenesis TaxID=3063995 RepID=A0ABT9ACN7_9BACT|nr:hypothetical protein [Hymenobacter sp. M29]MDO7846487.1 hypothetical protein [Hymenobacter sp. M29]
MQLQKVTLKLASITVPTPELNKSKGYVPWGEKHSFPATVLGLIRNSPTASAMLKRKAEFIAGEGFSINATEQKDLAAWLEEVKAAQLLEPTGVDAANLESYAWQVVWSKGKNPTILEIHHQGIETVVWGKRNAQGEVEQYFLCDNWDKADSADFPVVPMPAFNPKKPGGTQLYVFAKYSTGQRYYQDLSITPGLNDMSTEASLGKYRKNSVDTRFGGNTIVSVRKGPEEKREKDPNDPTKEIVTSAKTQQQAFRNAVKAQFQGPEADSIFFVFGDGTDEFAKNMVEVKNLSTASPETYEKISDQAIQAILSAGGVTSPAVVGLPTQAGLGGGGQELREAYEMYDNTVCLPWRRRVVASLLELYRAGGREVAEVEGDTDPLSIVNTLPVRNHFDNDTLAQVLDDDEIRQAEGYAARKKPEDGDGDTPAQTEAQKSLSGSVGGQSSIDAMLNLLAQKLTTRESCIARLVTFFGLTKDQAESIVPLPDTQTNTVPPGTL